jgi:hypothetical protein
MDALSELKSLLSRSSMTQTEAMKGLRLLRRLEKDERDPERKAIYSQNRRRFQALVKLKARRTSQAAEGSPRNPEQTASRSS